MKIRLNTRAAVKAYMPFPVVNTVITKDLTIDTDQEMEKCREWDLSIEYIFFLNIFPICFLWTEEMKVPPKLEFTSAAVRMVARESHP